MSQRMNDNAASPAVMKVLGVVYGYVRQSGLASRLVDLVFLRVSQINGCAYCIDMHSRDVFKAGLPVEHLVLVAAWPEAGSIFDEQERAALAWAEVVTRLTHGQGLLYIGGEVLPMCAPMKQLGIDRLRARRHFDACRDLGSPSSSLVSRRPAGTGRTPPVSDA